MVEWRIFGWLLLGFLASGQGALAQTWHSPNRGTAERAALMDAMRPHAEWVLGAPVQFVVDDLRVAGALGYVSLSPQRPGGGQIDIRATPGFARGQLDADVMDGTNMHALYRRSGSVWVAVLWSVGATDVWFAAPEYCGIWRAVIPEYCVGQ
ncbi:hypothetical protein QEZ52_06070 [Aliisedimentitalea scapharcae]|uniref:Uncharacterized protein n=1 Tax=Aliisedimentitalea scapharcae TaxID=1524259 RepID=A0ABZ2XZP1_9RHOB